MKNSFAQSQQTIKAMYWNGKSLELIEAKVDINTFEIQELYYQSTVHSDKVKLKLHKKTSAEEYPTLWTATNPKTNVKFEVSSGMTFLFRYPSGQEKEFLYVMEYVHGDEKIMMGSMPILGEIIYQKANHTPELWLKDADFACETEQTTDGSIFICNFTTSKNENLKLRIDQNSNQVILWRNGEKIEFREP